MDKDLKEFVIDLIACLVKYGGLSEIDARQKLTETNLLKIEREGQRDALFHEYPYYWAMHLLYSKERPEWYQDPKLWPPPKEYLGPDWRKYKEKYEE